jgi:hypothetical protein
MREISNAGACVDSSALRETFRNNAYIGAPGFDGLVCERLRTALVLVVGRIVRVPFGRPDDAVALAFRRRERPFGDYGFFIGQAGIE